MSVVHSLSCEADTRLSQTRKVAQGFYVARGIIEYLMTVV
jgi:hypothetical protein